MISSIINNNNNNYYYYSVDWRAANHLNLFYCKIKNDTIAHSWFDRLLK